MFVGSYYVIDCEKRITYSAECDGTDIIGSGEIKCVELEYVGQLKNSLFHGFGMLKTWSDIYVG